MGVLNRPGAIVMTRTPRGMNSLAACRVRLAIAPLDNVREEISMFEPQTYNRYDPGVLLVHL